MGEKGKEILKRAVSSTFNLNQIPFENKPSRRFHVFNREFTHVRRRRQVDCYQYNDINPVAQKKYIIKRLA